MARARSSGNGRLEESIAVLNQSVAILNQTQAAFLARVSEMDRIHAEDMRRIDARFVQIEATLVEHNRILTEHNRVLTEVLRQMQSLTDEVRGKIGFKPER